MKKTFTFFLLLFVFISVYSQSRETWDLHFQVDVTAVTGFAGISGAETDGEYFYISNSLNSQVAKLDLSGNLIETFSIPNIPFGLEDLTTDGTYFYSGSGSAYTIFQMDFSSHTIVDDITVPMAVDGLAYDPAEDGFWITNWQNQALVLIDRNGIVLNQMIFTDGANGMTHQTDSAGNDYLWIFSGIYTGGAGIVTQYSLPGLTATTLTHNVTDDFPGTHAGGLFFSHEIAPGIEILGGIAKGTNCYLFGYEIGSSGAAPGPPTNFTLTADPAGAYEVTISWTNPSVDVNGNPLTELDEIRVYRDDDLIYTLTNPIIGEPASYTDFPAFLGMIGYSLHCLNSFGSSSVSGEVWVGPDVPAAVTNFHGEQINNTLQIELTWENPTTGLHGGPFPDPVLGYFLEETGIIHEIIGITNQYIFTVPTSGTYFFSIAAYNAIGTGGYATSNDIVVEITSTDPNLMPEIKLSNYPNPFNPSTTITFNVPQTALFAKIEIYNIKGQKVKTLNSFAANARDSHSKNSIIWDGTDSNNQDVPSGVYFYQLNVDGKVEKSNKMLLLK